MLDRLISGAGAVTDAADRMVRAVGRGGGESLLGHRPGSALVVRSRTAPAELFRFEAAGVVVEDAEYVKEDISFFADQATSLTFTLDPTRFLDATAPVDTATLVRDLADGIPAANTPIRISGTSAANPIRARSQLSCT